MYIGYYLTIVTMDYQNILIQFSTRGGAIQISCPGKHSNFIHKINIFGMAIFICNSILFQIKFSSVAYNRTQKADRSIFKTLYKNSTCSSCLHSLLFNRGCASKTLLFSSLFLALLHLFMEPIACKLLLCLYLK